MKYKPNPLNYGLSLLTATTALVALADNKGITLKRNNIINRGLSLLIASTVLFGSSAALCRHTRRTSRPARPRRSRRGLAHWLSKPRPTGPRSSQCITCGQRCLRSQIQGPTGQIWLFDDIATPEIAAESGYVTPNVTWWHAIAAFVGSYPQCSNTSDSAQAPAGSRSSV